MKSLLLIASLFAVQVYAANFYDIETLTNKGLEKAYSVTSRIAENSDIYGECGFSGKFKVELSNKNEKDLNTMKQLFVRKAGLSAADDEHKYVTQNKDNNTFGMVKSLLDFTMNDEVEDYLSDKQLKVHQKDSKDLAKAIYFATGKLENKSIKIYEGLHSYEDGSWNVLALYDTKNREVLLTAVGFCGT